MFNLVKRNEMVDYSSHKKAKGVIIKLDINMAFDKISYSFIV